MSSHLYDAIISAPFGRVGIKTANGRLIDLAPLSGSAPLQSPRDPFARRVCRELKAYFGNPRHVFRIPIALPGTEHQRRVWSALRRIPPGEVRSYGELAERLGSSPRAIGNACRSNPVAIVVPCHRVVSSSGVGGFMGKRAGTALSIKRWLLAHEGLGG